MNSDTIEKKLIEYFKDGKFQIKNGKFNCCGITCSRCEFDLGDMHGCILDDFDETITEVANEHFPEKII